MGSQTALGVDARAAGSAWRHSSGRGPATPSISICENPEAMHNQLIPRVCQLHVGKRLQSREHAWQMNLASSIEEAVRCITPFYLSLQGAFAPPHAPVRRPWSQRSA